MDGWLIARAFVRSFYDSAGEISRGHIWTDWRLLKKRTLVYILTLLAKATLPSCWKSSAEATVNIRTSDIVLLQRTRARRVSGAASLKMNGRLDFTRRLRRLQASQGELHLQPARDQSCIVAAQKNL